MIVGDRHTGEIIHVWYFLNRTVAKVTLAVKSPIWRTYSAKTICPQDIGDWHLDVLVLQVTWHVECTIQGHSIERANSVEVVGIRLLRLALVRSKSKGLHVGAENGQHEVTARTSPLGKKQAFTECSQVRPGVSGRGEWVVLG